MVQHKWWWRGMIVAALAQASLAAPAWADEYDTMLAKWKARGGVVDTSDPDVIAQAVAGQDNAQAYWDTLERGAGRTYLWGDAQIVYPATESTPETKRSADITTCVNRLNTLAGAYFGGNAALKNNPDVLQAVLEGMQWLVDTHYRANVVAYNNWWDWQIGTPQAMNSLITTLSGVLPAAQRDQWYAAFDFWLPQANQRLDFYGVANGSIETGANRLDKAWGLAMRGVLGKDAGKLAMARDAIAPTLQYVATGDGFYADGSFIQHSHEPYIGGYGGVLLADIARLYYLLDGSTWELSDVNKNKPYEWAMNAFRPFMFDGAMMDSQRGRGIANQYISDHYVGRGIVTNLLGLAQVLPEAQAADIKSVLKGWMMRDTSFGASYFTPVQKSADGTLSSMSGSDVTRLKAILNDSTIVAAAEPDSTHVFASADRVLQRKPGHAFSLSLFSKRMSAFEYGNGENTSGWWTGLGMTYLYNGDQQQFGGNYWATVDKLRLPGITTDRRVGVLADWKHYGNTKAAVGGAELGGQFAAVGMDFSMKNVTGSLDYTNAQGVVASGALGGKKAWFLFGDKMVATGAAISAYDAADATRVVETIVENRKLNGAGDNALTVNGVAQDTAPGWAQPLAATSWAHLAGSTAGADIGYVFPGTATVAGKREARTASWQDINAKVPNDAPTYTDHYLSLALNHGANPVSASYSYIVLPNKTAAQVEAFAANTGIAVLANTADVAAVRDKTQGVTGAVFWKDASSTLSASGASVLTSNKTAAIVMKQNGADLQVSVADPTQANTAGLTIDVYKTATAVVSQDAQVQVLQMNPIKLAVNTNGSAGKSFSVRFTVDTTSTLSATDDAYVRDGTYAGANYGTAGTLTVKADAVGYARKGLLKFDLSSIEGNIATATLKLTPVSVGSAPNITHNLYQTVDANWTEAAVTWNNRPANSGNAVASWVVPAANTTKAIDITATAQAALGGNKLLSFDVEAAANYGANGSVDYASKSHATSAYRPVLVITLQ